MLLTSAFARRMSAATSVSGSKQKKVLLVGLNARATK